MTTRHHAALAPGVTIDLRRGLVISAALEEETAALIQRVAHASGSTTVVVMDGFTGAAALIPPLEHALERAIAGTADEVIVVENLDAMDPIPGRPAFDALVRVREIVTELIRLRCPVIITALSPDAVTVPTSLGAEAWVALTLTEPVTPYALGMEYSAATLDAIDALGPLGEGEAYVRIGDAAPIKARVLP